MKKNPKPINNIAVQSFDILIFRSTKELQGKLAAKILARSEEQKSFKFISNLQQSNKKGKGSMWEREGVRD